MNNHSNGNWIDITELRYVSNKRKLKKAKVKEDHGYYRFTSNPDRFSFTLKKSKFKLGDNISNAHVKVFFQEIREGSVFVKLIPTKNDGDTRTTGSFLLKELDDRYRVMGGLPRILPKTKGIRFPITFIEQSLHEVIFKIQLSGVK